MGPNVSVQRLCTSELYSPDLLRIEVQCKPKTPVKENEDDNNGRIPPKTKFV